MIDDDDYLENKEPRKPGWMTVVYRWLLGIGGVAALVFGGIYAVHSLGGGTTAPQGDIPLIRAAQGPVKVRPKKPGGLEVPHQHLGIYRKNDPGEPVEDLLAPRKPAPAAKSAARPKGPAGDAAGPTCRPVRTLLADAGQYRRTALRLAAAKLAAAKPVVSEKAASASVAALPKRAKPAQQARQEKRAKQKKQPPRAKQAKQPKPAKRQKQVKQAERPKQVKPAKPPKRPAPKIAPVAAKAPAGVRKPAAKSREAAKAGLFRVQLGAFRTLAKARNHGRGLQRQHRSLLGRLNMVVERVDLGAKGIFYRLRAGPIANKQSARDLCRTLGKRRINCFIVSG